MPDETGKSATPDGIDWSVTTFGGNRRRQHEEFRALPFRQKLAAIEELGNVASYFSRRRTDDKPPRSAIESRADPPATEADHT